MTKTLDRAFRQVKALPDERQDNLGEIILSLVKQDTSELQLTDAQVREVERRMANPGPMIPFEAVLAEFNIRL